MVTVDLERANSRVATVEQRNVSFFHLILVHHFFRRSLPTYIIVHASAPSRLHLTRLSVAIIFFAFLFFHLAISPSIPRKFN